MTPNKFNGCKLLTTALLAFLMMTGNSLARIGASIEVIPLLRSADASERDFRNFAVAMGRVRYSDYLDQASPNDAEGLSRILERAQNAWLNGSQTVAQSLFKQIAEKALQQEWRSSAREVVQYAMLRLAQSAASENERDSWLRKAAGFDWESKPDTTLFPPPLLSRFENIRQGLLQKNVEVPLDLIFPGYSIVRVNGIRFDLHNGEDHRLKLPDASYRISAFSDAFPAIEEIMTRSQLLAFDSRRSPLVSGHGSSQRAVQSEQNRCDIGQINLSSLQIQYAADVFINAFCVKRINRAGAVEMESTVEARLPANFLPVNPGTDGLGKQNLSTSKIEFPKLDSDLTDHSEGSDHLLSRRSWIWIGVSSLAVGAAVAIYQDYRHHRDAAPTVLPNSREMN